MRIKAGLAPYFAIAIAFLLPGKALPAESAQVLEYPTPTIREEQKVMVDGVAETWRLQWMTPPKPVCEPSSDLLTCPCTGFAYGEGGNLALLRLRDGKVIDRLDLAQFFTDGPDYKEISAVVPRWPVDADRDFDASSQQGFAAQVAKRPVVQVMFTADYLHDGWGSEFYLETQSGPCGHTSGMLIGVTKRYPRLHAVGAASSPGTALRLNNLAWDALRQKSGPFEILDVPCGDHGAETETRVWLHWAPNGVDGTIREYACSSDLKHGKLLHERPLSAQ